MKKILQILSIKIEDAITPAIKNKALKFIHNHPEIFCLSLLAIACFIFLFAGLNFYPLMDVDETRYAVMARDLIHSLDFNALKLNMVPFLEKPPLYFWIVGLSIKIFGKFSTLAVRLPIGLLSTFIVFFTYYLGKKIISRKFGTISALILLSSMFFLLLSHVAIIDMVLTVFMTSAIYCGFLTHFCEKNERNKKIYWWLFYTFIGLGFLSKGILALAIPFIIIFLYNLITKTTKDIFKPINILPGILILLAIAMPWHVIMYKQYGYQFVKEYFLLHHFGRLMGSESLGRERPFLYFVPVFILGFMPWTLSFIAFLTNSYKKLTAKFKATKGKIKDKIIALFEVTTNEQKLLLFSAIYFLVIFSIFSISSTKLPTYILPVLPAASLLTGYYWWISDEKNENIHSISVITQIFATLFILIAMGASITYYFLPPALQYEMASFKQITILSLYLLSIFMLLRLNTKRALSIFSSYIFTMLFIVLLAVSQIFNFVYATGENEIVKYSRISTSAKPYNPPQLVTFDFSVKPSVMIEYKDKVHFVTDPNFNELDRLLKYKTGPTFVIVKNKNFRDDKEYLNKLKKRLKLVENGKKYSLYVQDVQN